MKKNIKKMVTLLLVMMLFFTNTMPILAQETGNSYYNTENYYSLNEVSSGYAARTNFTAVRGTGTVTAEGVLVEMGQYAEMPDM